MPRRSRVSITPCSANSEFPHETREALEIRNVRFRMEARRAAQSNAWEAICRIAGGDIDFEVDDLVALEARAQAEFDRTRAAEARQGW